MKIDRLVSIIMILLERDKVTAKELAEMFEVAPRTIYRDLDTINQAGIPIVSVSGPGNGVSIMENYKVEKRLFSTSDITALLTALNSVESGLPGKKMINTLAKIKGMIPEEERASLEFQARQIKVDMEPWFGAGEIEEKTELIKNAMEKQRLIQFCYRDLRNRESERTIEPYRLLLKSESWYVQGFCLERECFRTFKLVRTNKLYMLDETFVLRKFREEELEYGGFQDIMVFPVKLRFHVSILDDITTRFGKACIVRENEEYFTADVHMPVEELSCRYLLGFGARCECLEPAEMRNKMRGYAEEVYRLYV